MDAKPLRPLRAIAPISGNENIIPSKQVAQNRQKFAGNPKPMAAANALNAPSEADRLWRRRVGEPVGKQAVKIRTTKPAAAVVNIRNVRVEDKENRQSGSKENRQRANAAAKVVGQGPKSDQTVSAQTNNPASRGVAVNQQHLGTSLAQPPLRNGVSKKATSIYHDREDLKIKIRPEASPVDDLAALVTKPAKDPRHYKSQPVLRVEQQNLRNTQSKFLINANNLIEVEDEGEIDDNATEAAYEDALENLSEDAQGAAREALIDIEEMNYQNLQRADDRLSRASKALPEVPGENEPEEYWDEEEEQEPYDEQGYTTAHSFRSHGDNTTNGPTTMLAPDVTASIQKELEVARAHVLHHQTEEELEEEAWDTSMVAEYGDEIFAYMRDLETRMVPNPHYMEDQSEIQWSMRAILMDWLVQVHHRFCLLPETLFLAVNYIDRFLSVKVVSLGKLQLVGATALLVASKYEEINCPSVQEIVYMVDSGYTYDEIVKAERFMLSMLQFELGWPGPMSFLRRISKADDYDLETRTLAKYFLEITIMDERFVASPPSLLAAGAHCISRLLLGKGAWTAAHVYYSGYSLRQLKPLIKILFECCLVPTKHHRAVYDKYASPKYKQSSTYVAGKLASGVTLQGLYAAAAARPDTSSISGDGLAEAYPASSKPISTQA
ncbi:B-type cyclin [Collariella sp. IMI 366227]|nr:B-type cyclin [Collariella sp. IMI 366227]